MHHTVRFAAPAALLATAVALGGCAAAPAAPADDAPTTVIVENAKPAFTANADASAIDQTVVDPEVPAESVEVPYQPSSVVTFDIATLDTLDAIGMGDVVVAIPDVVLPAYLSEYAELPKVGTMFEPDFEAVSTLAPELIVTAGRSSAAFDELSEVGTTIDLTASSGGAFNPAKALERAEQLGEIFGEQDAVAELASEIESGVTHLQGLAADAGPAVFLAVSGGDYSAFAEGSRFGWFFDTVGFKPAVTAAELPGAEGSAHGDVVSNEFLLSVNPEWLLVLDRGTATGTAPEGASAAEVLDNEIVAQTTAAQEGHIVYLPSSELYIVTSGLTAVQNVLDAVQTALEG